MGIRGFHLVFEGIDGSGKSTQHQRFVEWAQAYLGDDKVLGTVEPTRAPPSPEASHEPVEDVTLEEVAPPSPEASHEPVEDVTLEEVARATYSELKQTRAKLAEVDNVSIGALIRRGLFKSAFSRRTLGYLFAADRSQHFEQVVEPALAQGLLVVQDRYVLSSIAYQGGTEPPTYGFIRDLNSDFPKADLTIFLEISPGESLERLRAQGRELDQMESGPVMVRNRMAYHQAIARRRPNIIHVNAVRSIDDVHERVLKEIVRFEHPLNPLYHS